MEQIVFRCWFIDSEEFIAKLIAKESLFRLKIRKIIDPMHIITSRAKIDGEFYEFFGKAEDINKLAKVLKESDFDVEVNWKDS